MSMSHGMFCVLTMCIYLCPYEHVPWQVLCADYVYIPVSIKHVQWQVLCADYVYARVHMSMSLGIYCVQTKCIPVSI